eukprot:scaffold59704_cov64-Phaeocystis_antarctica.AAC.2
MVHDEVTTIFSTLDRTVLRTRATSVPLVALEASVAASCPACPASCAASVASITRAITATRKTSPQQKQDLVRRRNLPLRALRAIAACTGSRQLRGAGSEAPPRGSAGLAAGRAGDMAGRRWRRLRPRANSVSSKLAARARGTSVSRAVAGLSGAWSTPRRVPCGAAPGASCPPCERAPHLRKPALLEQCPCVSRVAQWVQPIFLQYDQAGLCAQLATRCMVAQNPVRAALAIHHDRVDAPPQLELRLHLADPQVGHHAVARPIRSDVRARPHTAKAFRRPHRESMLGDRARHDMERAPVCKPVVQECGQGGGIGLDRHHLYRVGRHVGEDAACGAEASSQLEHSCTSGNECADYRPRIPFDATLRRAFERLARWPRIRSEVETVALGEWWCVRQPTKRGSRIKGSFEAGGKPHVR